MLFREEKKQRMFNKKSPERFLLLFISFLIVYLLSPRSVFACPSGYCDAGIAGGQHCVPCSDFPDPEEDPSCNCSGTQCCQANGQCGPCSGSGQWKGRHVFAYLDNFPHRLWRPDFSWDSVNSRFWISGDKSSYFDKYKFDPSDITIAWFGESSWHDSGDDKDCCDDITVKVHQKTFSMNNSTGWSAQSGGSCKESCYKYVAVTDYPDYLKNQGIRPAGLYTLEPTSNNIQMNVMRQGLDGSCYCSTAVGEPHLLAARIEALTNVTIYTDPFVITEEVSGPVSTRTWNEGGYREGNSSWNKIGTPDVTLYYRKQSSNGSWSGWQTFGSSLASGTYQIKAEVYVPSYSNSEGQYITNLWVELVHCCREDINPVRLPENTAINQPAFDLGVGRGQVDYSFKWNFQPNFTGPILMRILDAHPKLTASSSNRINFKLYEIGSDGGLTDISSSAQVVVGSAGDDTASFAVKMTLSKDKKYQIAMSSWLRIIPDYYYDTSAIFTFLVGVNPYRTYDRCRGLTQNECGFLDYFMEDGADYIFLPFLNENLTTGTVVGNVYQTLGNTCTGTDVPDSADDWQAFCKRSEDADPSYKDARKDSASQFTCWIDDTEDFDVGDSYTVKVEASSPTWQLADCSLTTDTVTVEEDVNTVGPFFIWQGQEAWLQTIDGDVGAQGSLAFDLPLDEYLAVVSQADTPGVVSYNSGTPDFGQGFASTEDWLAETALNPKGRTFSGFQTLLGDPTAEENAFTNLSSLSTGTYFYDEGISLNAGDALSGGNKVVLLVDGDVAIDADLTVAEGDFLAIIASGTIAFGADVVQAQGIFFAGGQITIASGETQFLGEGMFSAIGGFSFGRDLETAGNLEPAEIFTFRPDLLINSPTGLWVTSQTWQEVAP